MQARALTLQSMRLANIVFYLWQSLTLVQGHLLQNSHEVLSLSLRSPPQFLSRVRIGTAASSTPFDLVVWLGWPGPPASLLCEWLHSFSGQGSGLKHLGSVFSSASASELNACSQHCVLSLQTCLVRMYTQTFSEVHSL